MLVEGKMRRGDMKVGQVKAGKMGRGFNEDRGGGERREKRKERERERKKVLFIKRSGTNLLKRRKHNTID